MRRPQSYWCRCQRQNNLWSLSMISGALDDLIVGDSVKFEYDGEEFKLPVLKIIRSHRYPTKQGILVTVYSDDLKENRLIRIKRH